MYCCTTYFLSRDLHRRQMSWFSFRICWNNSEVIVPSVMKKHLGLDAASKAQTMIQPSAPLPATHSFAVWCSPFNNLMNLNICQHGSGVTLGSFMIIHTLLLGDLCGSTTPGECNSGLEYPPFVHNLSDCGTVESKLFWDDFVTLSSFMSINNPLPEFLRELLCSWHDAVPQTQLDSFFFLFLF